MKRRKLSPRSRTRSKSHFVYTLLALGMSCHSCADIPAGSELTARIGLDAHVKAWDWAVLDHGSLPEARLRACACDAFQGHRRVFSACRHFLQTDSHPCSQLDRQTAPFAKRLKEENRIDHHEAQPKINTSSASRFVPDSSAARNYFGRLPWPVQVLPDSSRYRITPDDFFNALLRVFFATTFPAGLTALATRSLKQRSVPASRTFFFSHIVGLTDPRGRPM